MVKRDMLSDVEPANSKVGVKALLYKPIAIHKAMAIL